MAVAVAPTVALVVAVVVVVLGLALVVVIVVIDIAATVVVASVASVLAAAVAVASAASVASAQGCHFWRSGSDLVLVLVLFWWGGHGGHWMVAWWAWAAWAWVCGLGRRPGPGKHTAKLWGAKAKGACEVLRAFVGQHRMKCQAK